VAGDQGLQTATAERRSRIVGGLRSVNLSLQTCDQS
jgi:hypothetical protein